MKKYLLILILPFFFASCNDESGDIDALQAQLDALEGRVDDVESAQQAALQAALESLAADIASLQSADAGAQTEIDAMVTEITDLLAALALLQSDVDGVAGDVIQVGDDLTLEANSTYWGNVDNEIAYTELAAGTFKLISGNVSISTADHVTALADIKIIGGDLNVAAGVTVDLAVEKVVGSLNVEQNETLTSLSLSAVTVIGGDINIWGNWMLDALDLSATKLVGGEAYIDGQSGYTFENSISTFDMSALLHVNEYFYLYNMSTASLSFPALATAVSGLDISNVDATNMDFSALTATNSLSIQNNQMLATMDFSALTSIKNGLYIASNNASGGGGCMICALEGETGLVVLTGFNALESVGSSISIVNNTDLTSIDGFDALTDFTSTLTISGNPELNLIEGFNAVTSLGNIYIWDVNPTGGAVTMNAFNGATDAYFFEYWSDASATFDFTIFENVTKINNGFLIDAGNSGTTTITGLTMFDTAFNTTYIGNNLDIVVGASSIDYCQFETANGAMSVNVKVGGADVDLATEIAGCGV